MFDRYEAGEQAVLVHIYFSQDKDTEDLNEFESLVSSAGVEALQVVTGSRKAPHPKYFVGEGKAEEIADAVKASGASVVLFDHSLSPAQERNLERLCECRVIDRTGLILDIFAQRARTHEGKLQVELAQLRHIATRLVRGWTHLERQKGGIGLRNRSASGASVWVLSNRRANSEMAGWLEQHEKQSELLGGAGDLLANSQADPYLSQAVLDLQFGHSQRVGYDVAVKVLQQLQSVGSLHKRRPEHASLGVLRSPDIPSLLVETGFISNSTEERLLGSSAYQEKIAKAIHNGLRSYFLAHPLQADPKVENRPLDVAAAVNTSTPDVRQPEPIVSSAGASRSESGKTQIHVVKRAETLSGIADSYGTTMAALRDLNKLKKDGVWVGQRLKVPAGKTAAVTAVAKAKTPAKKPSKHKVARGDTLSSIASRYGVSVGDLKRVNNLKSDVAPLDRTLTIPQA